MMTINKIKEYCDRDTQRIREVMDRINSLEQVKRWISLGRHSKYPECCIEWFCTHWFFATKSTNRRYARLLHTLHEQEKYIFQPGFIPCPKTVRERRVVYMHHCDPREVKCRLARGMKGAHQCGN